MHPPETRQGRPAGNEAARESISSDSIVPPTSCPCGCVAGERCVIDTTPRRAYLERVAARTDDPETVARLRRLWREAS